MKCLFQLVLFVTLAGHVLDVADPAAASGAWLDPAWPFRIELTADPALIEGNDEFTDFTLLLWLNGSAHANVFAAAKSDGSDLIVTAADGTTILGREVVTYDAGAQEAEIWFKAPVLSKVTNRFYLYYGNGSGNGTQPVGAAWDPAYVAVYHFADDPALRIASDSGTRNAYATVPVVSAMTSADHIPGQIGKGWNLDGQNDRIDGDRIQSSNRSYTISSWFALSNRFEDANFAMQIESGFWHMSVKRNGGQRYPDLTAPNGFLRWNPLLDDDLLHLFVWTLDADADTARFYYDGVEQAFNVRYAPNPPYKVYTGELIQGNVTVAGPLFDGNPFDLMEGTIDEFRVYEGVRSPAWVKTEYRNQKTPSSFFAFRQENHDVTSVGSFGTTRIHLAASPNPSRGLTEISVDVDRSELEIAVYDVAGRRVRSLWPLGRAEGPFRLQWDGRDELGLPVGSGIYFVRANGSDVSATAKFVLLR